MSVEVRDVELRDGNGKLVAEANEGVYTDSEKELRLEQVFWKVQNPEDLLRQFFGVKCVRKRDSVELQGSAIQLTWVQPQTAPRQDHKANLKGGLHGWEV